MNLEGTCTFVAPQEVVWAALLDPDVPARIMPGCDWWSTDLARKIAKELKALSTD